MVFIEHNSLKSDIFLIPYLFHVFQDSCFSGFRFFRVQVFQSPGFSGSRFFRVQVFSGSRFSRVQFFQGPGPGFRSSLFSEHFFQRAPLESWFKIFGCGPKYTSCKVFDNLIALCWVRKTLKPNWFWKSKLY